MARVLVIGASRVLDTTYLAELPSHRATHGEELLAQSFIAREVSTLDGADVILTGGCPHSGDRWALEHVLSLRRFHGSTIDLAEYRTDGLMAWASGKQGRRWLDRIGYAKALERDEYVTEKAVELQRRGYEVRGYFVEAAWSPTHGTAYTARRMSAMGLATQTQVIARDPSATKK